MYTSEEASIVWLDTTNWLRLVLSARAGVTLERSVIDAMGEPCWVKELSFSMNTGAKSDSLVQVLAYHLVNEIEKNKIKTQVVPGLKGRA